MKITEGGGLDYTVERQCPVCQKFTKVSVNYANYMNYLNRTLLAQEAFPHLDPQFREVLITGIDPICWEDLFGIPE